MGKWEMVRLGDVFKIASGGTPVKNRLDYYNKGTIPWVKTGDLKEKYVNSEYVERITDLGLANSSAKLFPSDTVLIAMYGATIGATSILNFEACTNQACAAFLPSQSIQCEFLYYFLLSQKANFIKLGVGGAQPNISATILKEVKIPLPPLEEQKRIAKNLDLASEIVKDYKEQLVELDKLVQSVFYGMFGDPVTNEKGWISQSLLDFGSCKNGMNFGANEKGIEIKYLGVGHFKELSIIDGVDKLSTISLMQAPSKEYLLKDEDIIFVRSNGNKNLVGRCVVVYPGDAALTFSGFCIRFRKSSDKLMTIYLLYVLKCASVRRLLLGRGANIQNLNQQILKQLKVPVPPISLQAQFVEIIIEIENQKKQIQQALTEAEMLLNSLMQKYFE